MEEEANAQSIALFTIIRTDRNMLLACYSHKHISYRIRTIIRKAIISGICRRKHFNLEGKVVNSSEYVMDQQKARYEWNGIPWRKLKKSSFKLQKRMYQASKCNDIKKMHNLQRLLLKSTSARTIAVRRVTQDNRGEKTAGIDGKANLSQKERLQLANSLDIREKAKPSRRV
ncbi:reverse transcriptase N-terminal domain-containing protein [Wolbachia endosymbiont (group A) of Scambus nigricans]|uniref:reverse transcriptase N-terminal domain-containing protein n=1 Tax=Wolbachia endosymbiont (group A) of Scambus nigricans TaxID=2954055 RepID=UPI002230426D|nr:reverse transcriptase N-terminal domain-containing protein [Wolbachia endosymbiont (group A) of Scambus nigricans]